MGPLVKAHPRDATDYEALFPGAVILERTMPSEVLNFALPFRFARAVTVESTVLKSLEVADEALELTLRQALAPLNLNFLLFSVFFEKFHAAAPLYGQRGKEALYEDSRRDPRPLSVQPAARQAPGGHSRQAHALVGLPGRQPLCAPRRPGRRHRRRAHFKRCAPGSACRRS